MDREFLEKSTQKKEAQSATARTGQGNGSLGTFQFVDNRPETGLQRAMQAVAENRPRMPQPAQRKAMIDNRVSRQPQFVQKKENKTGLPDNLKSGIESLSGISMGDVKVHANSSKPAQLNALAFAQGSDIHLGPGQEKHLPHEAWHVVQQKQGRVGATVQMAGVPVNDDPALEREADLMGGNAASWQFAQTAHDLHAPVHVPVAGTPTLQGLFGMEKESRIAIKGVGDGVIAKGAGFTVEPDNGNGGKILEFITDPFDEHSTKESVAIDAFTKQLTTIWGMMEEIKASEDDKPVDGVFTKYGLAVKQSAKRRAHHNDSFNGPVHFTVGLKLQEMGAQLAGIQKLSTKPAKSKTQDARMDHVGRSGAFARNMATLAATTYGAGEITNALAGYFSLAFLTIAGWQFSLTSGEAGLKKQIPLAFMKMYPSAVLAGIAADAIKKKQPDVLEWVKAKATDIKASAVANLPLGGAGGKSLQKWLNWLVGQNDAAINIIDEQVTIIADKESLGTASAIPYGYAAELRNINIGDQSSLGSVRSAGIDVIRMSRGSEKSGGSDTSGVSEKDRSYSQE